MPEDESRFLSEYVRNGGNGTNAALTVWPYLKYGAAANASWRLLKTHQGAVAAYMDAQGLTIGRFAQVLRDSLVAEQAVVVKKGKDENKGILEDVIMVPDAKVRIKAVEVGLKMRGALKANDDEIPLPPNIGTLNLTVTSEEQQAFTEWFMAKTHEKLLINAQNNVKELE